jgi:hypothetical protein
MTSTHWNNIVNGAKARDMPMAVTPEYLSRLFDEQSGRCALTGVPIVLDVDCDARLAVRNSTASLDRIDSSVGYVPGNCRWVHRTINIMRNMLSDDAFVAWCRLVVEHRDRISEGAIGCDEMPESCPPPIRLTKKNYPQK